MSDALQMLQGFRDATTSQPWPVPGADLGIVAYGAWLHHAADFWKESGEGIQKKFATDRKRIERLTAKGLQELRVAVQLHGEECVKAIESQAKQSKSEAARLRAEALAAEQAHRHWMETDADRETRWADDLEHARGWSEHHTQAWLQAIDNALSAPLDSPLIAFGLPPGGEEIPECSWHGVFHECQQEYPGNSGPNKFKVTPSADEKRPNASFTDYGLAAQTLARCDVPGLAAPPSYLAALREQGKSPWMAARVIGEILCESLASPVNEFLDTRPAGSDQLTEWWWFSVMPQIHAWYARHQPAGRRQKVLHLWEMRVEVSDSGKTSHVHHEELLGTGLSFSKWLANRKAGRTLSSQQAEAIALSIGALLDSLCHHAASLRIKIEPEPGRTGALVTWYGIKAYARPALVDLLSRAGSQHRIAGCRIADRKELDELFPGIGEYLPTEDGTTGKGQNSHVQATFVSLLVGMVDDLRPLEVDLK
ncbi:MAG: hypothetical protein IT464_01110 [Planctomycetes bacterium]|nr:hypothetical protein [Planctomycetota bacterium]